MRGTSANPPAKRLRRTGSALSSSGFSFGELDCSGPGFADQTSAAVGGSYRCRRRRLRRIRVGREHERSSQVPNSEGPTSRTLERPGAGQASCLTIMPLPIPDIQASGLAPHGFGRGGWAR